MSKSNELCLVAYYGHSENMSTYAHQYQWAVGTLIFQLILSKQWICYLGQTMLSCGENPVWPQTAFWCKGFQMFFIYYLMFIL